MVNNILDRTWNRVVEWWMYRNGAEEVEVDYMDKTFTVPVYPLSWEQQVRLQQAIMALRTQPELTRDSRVFKALTVIQEIAEEITEYKVSDMPTEVVKQIVESAPKEGLR